MSGSPRKAKTRDLIMADVRQRTASGAMGPTVDEALEAVRRSSDDGLLGTDKACLGLVSKLIRTGRLTLSEGHLELPTVSAEEGR